MFKDHEGKWELERDSESRCDSDTLDMGMERKKNYFHFSIQTHHWYTYKIVYTYIQIRS